jgi:hypothetical protein
MIDSERKRTDREKAVTARSDDVFDDGTNLPRSRGKFPVRGATEDRYSGRVQSIYFRRSTQRKCASIFSSMWYPFCLFFRRRCVDPKDTFSVSFSVGKFYASPDGRTDWHCASGSVLTFSPFSDEILTFLPFSMDVK